MMILMNYYAIQTKTRSEEKFIRLFRSLHPHLNFPMYFPKKQLINRQKGVLKPSIHAVFPGYIFIEAEHDDLLASQWEFRKTKSFYRFLKSNQDISPLAGKDLELVFHFINMAGALAGISKVEYNENSRIIVLEGPLAGLEGKIIKVDKRKKRAKVKLNLYDDSFVIDFAFEIIGKAEFKEGDA